MPQSPPRRRSLVLLSALAFLPLLARHARAHAIILESTPEPGGVLVGPDITVAIRFNSRIDYAHSQLALILADGSLMPLTLGPVDAQDLLAASAVGLAPGVYRLLWQVLSLDGHITRGEIPFAIQAP